MIVDRDYIGNEFHNLMWNMAENYTLQQLDGEEYQGKISLVAKTASTYMLGEREYLMTGTATFPDIEAQKTFRGCYFHRQTNPDKTYMLSSVIAKDTTPYVADVYAMECNANISLGYLTEELDKKGDRVKTLHLLHEDIPVYWDSTLQKQKRSSDGNYDQTIYFVQIPARYGVSQEQVITHKQLEFNEKTKLNEIVDVRYRVESVDTSLAVIDETGVYGIYDVQLSLDTRG